MEISLSSTWIFVMITPRLITRYSGDKDPGAEGESESTPSRYHQPINLAGCQCINMPTRKSISYKGSNNMDIYDLIAAKRGEILSLAERCGVKNIRVFGSVARHEAHERSDIDFLVEFPPGASLLTHAAFQRELSALLGRDVDVASVKGLKDQIRSTVMQEAVPL
jgi:hypothetical protein